jgi:hypothetical protein
MSVILAVTKPSRSKTRRAAASSARRLRAASARRGRDWAGASGGVVMRGDYLELDINFKLI